MLLDLAAAGLVYWRVPVYLAWIKAQGGRALPLVARDGLIAGLLFAGVTMSGLWLTGGGEPIADRSAPGEAIWFAVLGAVGAVNALVIYLVNWAAQRAVRGR